MEPFTFCVPLRPRASAKDWGRVVELFNASLTSALAQSQGVSVVVGATDVPEGPFQNDPRVRFVHVPRDADQMRDKHSKKQAALYAAGERGAGLVMFLDADDHVHKNVVEHARSTPGDGLLVKKGYEYVTGTGKMWRLGRFDQFCGTCAVFRFAEPDFPKAVDDHSAYASGFGNHALWAARARDCGRPLKPIPFEAVTYSVANGENHTFAFGGESKKRKIYRALVRGREPGPSDFENFAGLSAIA